MFLLFNEMVAMSDNKAEVDVLLEDVNSNCTKRLTAERKNPFTFVFTAPGKGDGQVRRWLAGEIRNLYQTACFPVRGFVNTIRRIAILIRLTRRSLFFC